MTASPPAAASEAARVRTRAAVLHKLEEAARVRLGAAADTTADMLRALAEDPSVTVRAAVAMNRAAPVQVDQLLAGDTDARVRTLLARKLATLLPSVPSIARDTLQSHVFTMLAALIEDEAVRVRAAIADVVKDMPHAPRALILRLAHDSSLPVSEPVVRLSPLLAQEDLLALLADAHAPGIATAMAQRAGLSESVADQIAATADTQAIAALLGNRSAAIREATLDALIDRAPRHADWHEPLVRRPALSARAARALSEIVTTQLLSILASRGDLGEDLTWDLQRRLAQRVAQPPSPADAQARAYAMLEDGSLTEAALLAAAQGGDSALCTAMLALSAEVPLAAAERAATLRSAKGVVSLVWKAGFTMRVAGALQALLCNAAPEAVLPGRDPGSFPLAIEEMRWHIEFLQRGGR